MYLDRVLLGYIIVMLLNKSSPEAQSSISAQRHAKYLCPRTYQHHQQHGHACVFMKYEHYEIILLICYYASWNKTGQAMARPTVCVDDHSARILVSWEVPLLVHSCILYSTSAHRHVSGSQSELSSWRKWKNSE